MTPRRKDRIRWAVAIGLFAGVLVTAWTGNSWALLGGVGIAGLWEWLGDFRDKVNEDYERRKAETRRA